MNIEEERKAFEASVLGGTVFAAIKWNGSKYTFHDGGSCMTQDMFDVWLKAKAHAAEMAKPVYNPEPYNGGWGVQDLQHKYWHTLQTKAQAIEEAKEQGYRVIE